VGRADLTEDTLLLYYHSGEWTRNSPDFRNEAEKMPGNGPQRGGKLGNGVGRFFGKEVDKAQVG
jgi:hypothetical protein